MAPKTKDASPDAAQPISKYLETQTEVSSRNALGASSTREKKNDPQVKLDALRAVMSQVL